MLVFTSIQKIAFWGGGVIRVTCKGHFTAWPVFQVIV